jgi:hypothetical protein
VLREVPLGQSPNRRTYFQYGQVSHFRREGPRRKPSPVPFVREIIGRHRASHSMTGPRASHPGSCNHSKSRGGPGYTHYGKAQGQPPYRSWSQHLSYFFLYQTQVLQENYCLRHIRAASRVLFHSAFSLLLGRVPFLSLLFNFPRNPYSSARVRPSI